jgi:hypothetical protein
MNLKWSTKRRICGSGFLIAAVNSHNCKIRKNGVIRSKIESKLTEMLMEFSLLISRGFTVFYLVGGSSHFRVIRHRKPMKDLKAISHKKITIPKNLNDGRTRLSRRRTIRFLPTPSPVSKLGQRHKVRLRKKDNWLTGKPGDL